jgi:hypothetical protein
MNSRVQHKPRAFTSVLVLAALAAVALPNPASVLCVAPDGHVAIEDISAPCCDHNETSSMDSNRPHDAVGEVEGCGNCVDFLLDSDSQGMMSSSTGSASNSAEDSAPRSPEHADARQPSGHPIPETVGPLLFLSPSIPLRC